MAESRYPLSHLTLHAPSVGLPYWFVSHDFAGVLGLDYSRDAATQLKQLLADWKVSVDHEADEVTLRIRRNEDVIPALRAIYARAGWDPAELAQVEEPVRTFKRPRARKIAACDTVLVPFGGEVVGLGQVLEVRRKVPTVALFRATGPAREMEQQNPAALKPLSILHLGLGCSLFTGEWPVFASHPVVHSPAGGFRGDRDCVGAISFGGDGPAVAMLRAHAELDTWEQGYADPEYLRKFVIQ